MIEFLSTLHPAFYTVAIVSLLVVVFIQDHTIRRLKARLQELDRSNGKE